MDQWIQLSSSGCKYLGKTTACTQSTQSPFHLPLSIKHHQIRHLPISNAIYGLSQHTVITFVPNMSQQNRVYFTPFGPDTHIDGPPLYYQDPDESVFELGEWKELQREASADSNLIANAEHHSAPAPAVLPRQSSNTAYDAADYIIPLTPRSGTPPIRSTADRLRPWLWPWGIFFAGVTAIIFFGFAQIAMGTLHRRH